MTFFTSPRKNEENKDDGMSFPKDKFVEFKELDFFSDNIRFLYTQM